MTHLLEFIAVQVILLEFIAVQVILLDKELENLK